EDTYKYDLNVSYQKQNMFRVSLRNQRTNHEQIILKNNDGVYVLTPSLNKTFKFQSEWPYNNSQVYLYQSLVNDILSDKERTFKEDNGYYIFSVKGDYPNNPDLKRELIYFDKKLNLKEVHVLDSEERPKIKVIFRTNDMDAKFEKNYFAVENNMNVARSNLKEEITVAKKIEDKMYPMYLPSNTHLAKEDRVTKTDGERVIMTFAGDKNFTLIEETTDIYDKMELISVYGDPVFIGETIGALTKTSATWIDNGMEFYLVFPDGDEEEILAVANSLTVVQSTGGK
ncbi:MAG TPA: outer membrane lipoprotein carrier protein LolA, partial [Tenericutes bacterium]|nr:outer membrane lipoprotein carrier protein LolA [Mycoplasmatota bacterium]